LRAAIETCWLGGLSHVGKLPTSPAAILARIVRLADKLVAEPAARSTPGDRTAQAFDLSLRNDKHGARSV
jgi:hypothetical protein